MEAEFGPGGVAIDQACIRIVVHKAGLGSGANCSLLGAMLVLALVLAPLAAAAALRIAVE